jgi:CheY-like chemotaxis protein
LSESQPRAIRILLVEDDADNREVMAEFLLVMGYDVQAAVEGDAAIEILQSGWMPDLIMSDLMMPGMNGWQLLAALKGDQRWRGIKTMIVSAVANRLPTDAGADATLNKPASPEAILELIGRLTHPPSAVQQVSA